MGVKDTREPIGEKGSVGSNGNSGEDGVQGAKGKKGDEGFSSTPAYSLSAGEFQRAIQSAPAHHQHSQCHSLQWTVILL